MVKIQSTVFDDNVQVNMKQMDYSENWPVVYVINNDNEAYVGETVNATIRASQHLRNDDRRRLTQISIISDDNFNKSVILDLESYLINHMSADGKYILQNNNMGMQPHAYFQKADYEKTFSFIWEQLRKNNIVDNSIIDIHNSDIFKYSPYKTLTVEQYKVVDAIIQGLVDRQRSGENSTVIVNGGGGTGKTVLALYLMKLIAESNHGNIDIDYEMDPGYVQIAENLNELSNLKVGLVVPMQSLRETIKKVIKNVRYVNQAMILSPMDVPKDTYDLLIVDEAHRLRQRKALARYPQFDANNNKFGLDKTGTELDWILKSSKNQILFYDYEQSVKPSDVDSERFKELQNRAGTYTYFLESQLRCAGGNDYIRYVKEIFSDEPPASKKVFDDYEFRLFDNVDEMIVRIKTLDSEYGLCRTVAGYSWKWESKKDKTKMDIDIDGKKYQWNTVNKDWVNSENSLNEIGCIHTIQGYELNYAGVILGNEIKYNPILKEIYIDKSNYHDLQGKTSLNKESDLKEYILNIYKTMCTRGIKGTFVYACDKHMREYLRQFF